MKRPIESDYTSFVAYARALERYCDEAERQELVAWWKRYPNGSVSLNEAKTFIAEDAIATGHRPLIFGDTQPPKREWIGLTDEEVRQMCGSVPSMKDAVREAEAKLKEKNNA